MSESAPKILTPEYYQRLKAVEERHPWARAMRRVSLDLLRSRTKHIAGPKLLDAGCGTGLFLLQCGDEFGQGTLTGFDLAADGLRIARDRGLTRLAAASSSALPFTSEAFDVIACHDLLQHLTRDEVRATLSEFGRVLSQDGLLLIRTAARRGLAGKIHRDSESYRQWEPVTLGVLLAEHGFEVDLAARVNWLPGLLADLRAIGKPQPHGDLGLALDPAGGAGWKGDLLSAYWALERRLVFGMGWRPSRGHTLFCLARKQRAGNNSGD